jgi:cytosine/adenosine deaminase-related metal-dependent hydrolase
LLRQIALDERWLVVHLNELDESDFELLAGLTERFHVAHCPRSHMYMEHSPFQFERLRDLGFNICLGTDSLASNDDLSLFAEMRAFRKSFPGVSAEEILSMVTLNAARAVGKSDALGRIRTNHLADMIAVPLDSSSENIFDEIIAFKDPVSFSMINGVKDTLQT